MMKNKERSEAVKQEAISLQYQLQRIIKLLGTEPKYLHGSWGTGPQSELKAKMHEARRDMVRLEKLMYWRETN